MAVFSVVGMIGWNIYVWKAVKDFFPLHLYKKQLVIAKQRIVDFLARGSAVLGTVLSVTLWHI
jgi:hypothetical protein